MCIDMNKRMFICITGIDGAGKTTIATHLTEYLRDKDIDTIYVYNRYVPVLLRPVIYMGKLLFHYDKQAKDYSEYSKTKKRTSRKYPFLAKGYQSILLIDYFFQTFFKIKVPLILGRSVVCDRYIYDTIVTDLSVDFNYDMEGAKCLLNKLSSLFPVPDIVFLIDLPEEVAFSRKNDVPSIDYLKDRRKSYIYIGKQYRMTIIDGLLPLGDIKSIIEKNIEGFMS